MFNSKNIEDLRIIAFYDTTGQSWGVDHIIQKTDAYVVFQVPGIPNEPDSIGATVAMPWESIVACEIREAAVWERTSPPRANDAVTTFTIPLPIRPK